MSLELAVVGIGTSVAKAIVKSRMGGHEVAAEAVSAVLELFKSKGENALEERETKHLLDGVGLRVAKSLGPFFEREGGKLDEGSREAVALAAAKTLDAAKLTPAALAERDLAPRNVLVLCKESSPDGARGFTDAETALYERILSEASQQIVDIASQLPLFTERTFAEILKRETQLLETTGRVLAELEQIRKQTHLIDPEESAARFEEEYRRAVARNLDVLELFGANVSNASRRHSLSIAYVTLTVDRKRLGDKPVVKSNLSEKSDPSDLSENLHAFTNTVPAATCLSETRRLLIRGVAGAGKTTLLQWIAVRSALKSFEPPLSKWNGTVPFFIRLRHCSEVRLPTPKEFPGLISGTVADKVPEGWVDAQLRAGRGIVLVDGVDEVSEARQKQVRNWLKDLVDVYGENRFVVSARTHIDENWLNAEKFESAEAQPMGFSQMREFIAHWHESVAKELDDEAEKAQLVQYSTHLQVSVSRTAPLRRLASNPLLCAMLCALHRDRRQHLPKDRIQLYQECIQALLERREKESGIDYSAYPRLTLRQQESLLQGLAYYLVKNGQTSLTEKQAVDQIKAIIVTMNNLPANATTETVLEYFIKRSGIVREPVKGRIDFIHRTFQEFFAAQAAVGFHDIGFLTNNAHDQEWREIIVIAAGLAPEDERNDLIKQLISRGDDAKERMRRPQLHLLAAACLETTITIDPNVKSELEKRIAELIPPKDEEAATALTSAGDLAVPHLLALLEPGRVLSAKQRALCGRVLSQLGDPRPGIGLTPDGLPDIVWCDVPAGDFLYGDNKWPCHMSEPFRIAKYPVTFQQFQAFIDAPDGYVNEHWWQGLLENGLAQQRKGAGKQEFEFANHPRENVSWYDAMAFCRWLSVKLQYEITLPTEEQWEKAARGTDGRAYPYGNEFDTAKGNTSESDIRKTSAVGIFPNGESPYGVLDMSGNVWEWTLTEYSSKDSTNLSLCFTRVLRGGSFDGLQRGARATARFGDNCTYRFFNVGVRLVSLVLLQSRESELN